jgi:SAM-dependent methyltransferase
MLCRNNSAIDTDILSGRIRMDLASLHRAEHAGVGPGIARKELLPDAIVGVSSGAAGPRRSEMGIANKIRRVPIIGEFASWAAWILRIRRVARAAFAAEAGVANSHHRAARIEARLGDLEGRLGEFDGRLGEFDGRLGEFDGRLDEFDGRLGEFDGRLDEFDGRLDEFDGRFQRATDDLRKSLEAASRNAGEQIAAVRREVMFQQRRLSRVAEMLGNDSASRGEVAPLVRNQRLDALYEAFEDKYRGSRADIKQWLVVYLDRLKLTGAGQAESPVVDIGCGRGEWLELLRENGLVAYGIDVNSMMVERTISLGLDARVADLITHLRTLSDASRSAITAFHIVEHLPFETLIDFLDEALRVLLPGGMLILETPNPENMRVGATTFYNDPTHRNPIPPEPLRFIVEHRGFSDVEIERLHPSPESERLKGEGWDIAHLNALLFGPRDYAIIARRL